MCTKLGCFATGNEQPHEVDHIYAHFTVRKLRLKLQFKSYQSIAATAVLEDFWFCCQSRWKLQATTIFHHRYVEENPTCKTAVDFMFITSQKCHIYGDGPDLRIWKQVHSVSRI